MAVHLEDSDLRDRDRIIRQAARKNEFASVAGTNDVARARVPSQGVTVNKSDLSVTLMSVYKFFLKAGSLSAIGGRQGWQIQSIAGNGTP